MRKIRRNKKHNTVLVRKIRNLFDTPYRRWNWNSLVIDTVGQEISREMYAEFLRKMGAGVEVDTYFARHIALMENPEVIYQHEKWYFEVEIVDMGVRVYMSENCDELLRCHGCHHVITGDNYITTSDTGNVYCHECEEVHYVHCESCGEFFDENYITASNDSDRHICDGCYEDGADDWFFCDECEEYCVGESHGCYHNGDYVRVCESCFNDYYVCCDDCGEYYHENDGRRIDDWTWVCDGCLEENWRQCDGCDEYYRCDDMHYDDGDWYCESCWDERENGDDDNYNDDDGIRSYHDCRGGGFGTSNVGSYGMEYLLVATREENPMLGVELEIDCGGHNHENAREIRDAIGWNYIICSSDSTLDHGFELVSCPADLPNHMETLDWLSGVKKALELGYKSHDAGTCGLHTHIDRGFFEGENPQVTDSKFVVVLQNNVWWMRKFSRRDDRGGSWTWCSPNPRRYLDDEDKLDRESCKNKHFIEEMKNKGAYSHHLALNFDHGNTVEIRFYRGTLKYNSFLAALQCSDIWARLVKGISVEEASEIGLADFIRIAQHKRYTAFLDYINERNITLDSEPKRKLVRYMNNDEYKYVSC